MIRTDRDIILRPGERRVLEHPATLRAALFILIPFISLFDIYAILSGRVWVGIVLSLHLIGLVAVAVVIKTRLPDLRKVLIYRYVFQALIILFGVFMLFMVGILHQKEITPWAFVFILMVSIWLPDRTGIIISLVFHIGLAWLFLATGLDEFLMNKAYYIRYYSALVIFSLMTTIIAATRRSYFVKFFAARDKLKASEVKYKSLSRQLEREIEHRDRIEKQLYHAVKMETLGRVAAGVAHDLNNILSGIVTYPDLILLNMDRGDPLRVPLETVKESGVKAAAIVDDLLALSRRGVAVAESLDLREITAAYLNSPEHRQFMTDHDMVSVSVESDPGVKAVTGSSVHLQKTVMNLVTNGVEAVSGAGELFIRVNRVVLAAAEKILHPVQGHDKIPAGEYTVLSVSDTGAGIDPKDMGAVFEPFYTKKDMGRSGTGLGMALVLGTVNDHKGFIQMSSRSGQGTCVSLYFPVTEAVPERAEVPEKEPVKLAGNQESILVIDDEPIQLDIVGKLLTRLGYRVHCCLSGEAGLDLLSRHPMDLVMLDIIMEPGMDGVETCERILSQYPDQKVLFATGFSDKATLDRARSLGRGECLFKPYTLETIGTMVRGRLYPN